MRPASEVPSGHAAEILAAKQTGATDFDLHELVADAYFRQGGGGRAGLEVEFADVEWLNIAF
ncbi:hypothetical protein [Streptomyces sp. NPDC058254]|uniref:hypothetical protein n=1 Tax=Streptomyces sp. NPDC058254 TaxID=3346406 RepID=UPI0036E30AAA